MRTHVKPNDAGQGGVDLPQATFRIVKPIEVDLTPDHQAIVVCRINGELWIRSGASHGEAVRKLGDDLLLPLGCRGEVMGGSIAHAGPGKYNVNFGSESFGSLDPVEVAAALNANMPSLTFIPITISE